MLIRSRGCLGLCRRSGFFIRNVKNLEFGSVEIATEKPDERPSFWLNNVDGADFFRVKTSKNHRLLCLR